MADLNVLAPLVRAHYPDVLDPVLANALRLSAAEYFTLSRAYTMRVEGEVTGDDGGIVPLPDDSCIIVGVITAQLDGRKLDAILPADRDKPGRRNYVVDGYYFIRVFAPGSLFVRVAVTLPAVPKPSSAPASRNSVPDPLLDLYGEGIAYGAMSRIAASPSGGMDGGASSAFRAAFEKSVDDAIMRTMRGAQSAHLRVKPIWF